MGINSAKSSVTDALFYIYQNLKLKRHFFPMKSSLSKLYSIFGFPYDCYHFICEVGYQEIRSVVHARVSVRWPQNTLF